MDTSTDSDMQHDAFMAYALHEFGLESDVQFTEIEAALLQLEKSPRSVEHIDTVFRNFHTIKGSAGIFGFDALEVYCHALETELGLYREGAKVINPSVNSWLLKCNDHVRRLVQVQSGGEKISADDSRTGQWLLDSLTQGTGSKDESVGLPLVDALEPSRLIQPAYVQDHPDVVASHATSSLRVDAAKLDQLIDLVSELVIEQSMANAHGKALDDFELNEIHERVEKITDAVRRASLELRMVPIADTLNRFHRVVRDTSDELGKQVEFDIVGGDTELDKSLVDKIFDPLIHMIRNALDHGLETPAQRLAAGKSPVGRLCIEARHDGSQVTLLITDDGRGIDRQRILLKAIASGLISADSTLTDTQILELIFAPGFSTSDTITKLSGRGVGMDVVKRSIEMLRGVIQLESELGKGTSIIIRLPLTMASFDGFMVRVGGSHFVAPLDSIQEVLSSPKEASHLQVLSYFELRGVVTPIIHLRGLYQLQEPTSEPCSIVVMRYNQECFGVEVDHLVGQQQTVIKPLGRLFHKLPGIAGSTLLGDGTIALILDLDSLLKMAKTL